MALIESELGAPWHKLYAELSPEPIAAASLGQVRLLASLLLPEGALCVVAILVCKYAMLVRVGNVSGMRKSNGNMPQSLIAKTAAVSAALPQL